MIRIKLYEDFDTPITLNQVFNDCKEYIDTIKECNKGKLLIRGIYSYSKTPSIIKTKHNWNRIPLDVPSNWHDFLNGIFNSRFKWYVRSGIFCFFTDNKYSSGYGDTDYFVFPIGQFEYVWCPKIRDLFNEYEDEFNDNFMNYIDCEGDDFGDYEVTEEQMEEGMWKFQDDIENIILKDYKNNDICSIQNHVEVSINCDEYYLVSKEYLQKIIKYIWG